MKLKSYVTIFCLVTAALSALPACTVKKNLDEMHDSTKEMKDTTKEMNTTTEEMSENLKDTGKTTRHMSAVTELLLGTTVATYLDLRQGNGREIRRNELKLLKESESMDGKFIAAAAYHNAFEFQLVKNPDIDSDAGVAALYTCAVEEYFKQIFEFIPEDRDVPLLTMANDKTKGAFALAGAMHVVNPNTIALKGTNNKFKNVSLLELVQSGLRAKKTLDGPATENMPELPGYVSKVLESEQEAVYMMQLRYNLMVSLLLAKLSPISRPGVQFLDRLTGQINMLTIPWRGTTSDLNLVQLHLLIQLTEEIKMTRDFFTEIGESPRLNTTLIGMVNRMKYVPTGTQITPEGAATQTKTRRQLAEETLVQRLAETKALLAADLVTTTP